MAFLKKKILLIGGAGFIGSNLSKRLVEQGYKIYIFDNFSAGKLKDLKNIKKYVEIIKEDILNLDKLNWKL